MAKYGLNQVTLIGNLGRDPEVKYLDQGIAFANLWLACTESYRDKNGNNVDRTEWVSVNLWRSHAEFAAKYCRKGATVCVEGRLTTRTWDTPQGEKRSKTDVEGRRIILLDGRSGSGELPLTAVPVSQTSGNFPGSDTHPDLHSDTSGEGMDDLPF
ncbi:MAG: single-stranded DNA-binding protein [Bacteroidia bacterium]|nr:single-stranded DNA-binding protein [Bacteroidia bacterium]